MYRARVTVRTPPVYGAHVTVKTPPVHGAPTALFLCRSEPTSLHLGYPAFLSPLLVVSCRSWKWCLVGLQVIDVMLGAIAIVSGTRDLAKYGTSIVLCVQL